jgi:VIT1/CCC1 family predicted Fe2+/Mn2+ transporter
MPEVPLPLPLVPAQGMAHQQSTPGHKDRQHFEERSGHMTVSIPLVVIIGVLVYVAWRYMGLRVWHAIVCLILGFLLAATTMAPEIRNVLVIIVQRLTRP